MNTEIIRYGSIPGVGVFGTFNIADAKYPTAEREDLGNKRNVSCIPAGVYKLIPHISRRKNKKVGGLCYAIVNEEIGVYHYPDPKAIRFGCLIHIANWPIELEGCVAPGMGFHPGKWGVSRSTDAMRKIIKLLGKNEHILTIRWENR